MIEVTRGVGGCDTPLEWLHLKPKGHPRKALAMPFGLYAPALTDQFATGQDQFNIRSPHER